MEPPYVMYHTFPLKLIVELYDNLPQEVYMIQDHQMCHDSPGDLLITPLWSIGTSIL